MKPRKDLGLDEQRDKTGEKDEVESDGKESIKSSSVWPLGCFIIATFQQKE